MSSRFDRVRNYWWNKDIRNGVIVGLILGIPTFVVWLWSKSNFTYDFLPSWVQPKSALVTAWRATGYWLASPVDISHAKMLLVILVTAAGWTLAIYILIRLIREQAKAARERFAQQVRSLGLGDAAPVRLLRMVCKEHPKFVELPLVASTLSLSYPAAEKLVEDMQAAGVIEIALGFGGPKSVYLTKDGRDYCLQHGLDK